MDAALSQRKNYEAVEPLPWTEMTFPADMPPPVMGSPLFDQNEQLCFDMFLTLVAVSCFLQSSIHKNGF